LNHDAVLCVTMGNPFICSASHDDLCTSGKPVIQLHPRPRLEYHKLNIRCLASAILLHNTAGATSRLVNIAATIIRIPLRRCGDAKTTKTDQYGAILPSSLSLPSNSVMPGFLIGKATRVLYGDVDTAEPNRRRDPLGSGPHLEQVPYKRR
jgi:hypothetical protein